MRQTLLHVEDLDSEFPLASSPDRVSHVFAWAGMSAEGIGPHSGPGSFDEGAPGDKQPPRPVKDIAGKGQMKRRVVVMNVLLGRCPTGLATCVQEDH
jgi:hypothetical protein